MATAIVTGASQGLGAALAAGLADAGWSVVIDARHGIPLEEAGAAIRARAGAQVITVVGDVTDPEHRRRLVAAARSLGGVDLVVNNASTLGPSPLPRLDSVPLPSLRQVFDVNVVAPLALVQEAMVPLMASPDPRVVNMTSDAAVEAYDGWGGYGSSKAALDHLSAVLAAENPRLRVWAFDPGDMRTQMHQNAFPGEDISDRPDPATVVPVLLDLVAGERPSGRYRAVDLQAASTGSRP
ncbi:MAG TPA: SDR family NAD(P)-dependent oxidoreductase [Acidimicrobiales bacterium]|nr:SDR family NAD(P)-dependent oxidoreductase [Acidimicrobiales bacterium]